MQMDAPRRLCSAPRCSDLATYRGRCAVHSRAYEAQRGSAQQRGYTYEWAKFARAWRERFPICGMRADGQLYAEHSQCVQEGRSAPAEAVDHILSMANGGAQFDERNLQSLCRRCNGIKRGRVDSGRKRAAR